MKIIRVFFALMMMGFVGGATASMMTADTNQVGSQLSDVDGRTVPAPIMSDASHENDKSHFDGHVMNHYRDNNSWLGNSGHTFDHSFLEGDNYSWGSAHGHGDRCETIPPVGAVPVPAAIWLFGSALMGLMGITSRKTGSKAQTA
jgi:hypothetical protein